MGAAVLSEMKSVIDALETFPIQRELFNMTYKFVTNIEYPWEEENTENYNV